jgi:DNA-binding CsgD family transcriptional regulator
MDAHRLDSRSASSALDGTATHEYAPVRTLCRTALEALMVVDDDRRFRRVNEPCTDLFRSNARDLTSRRIDNYTSHEFVPLLGPLWDSLEREGELRGRYVVKCGDGRTRLVEYSAAREFVRGAHLIAARTVTPETPIADPVGWALVEPAAGRFIEVSSELCNMLDRSRDDLLAEGSLSMFRERVGKPRLLRATRDVVEGRRAGHDATAHALRPGAKPLPLSLAFSRVTGQDRRSVYVLLQATRDPRADGPELTERQTQILGLIGRGHTDREIADKLGLSIRTVEWHRDRLRRELRAESRADLFRAARERDLID